MEEQTHTVETPALITVAEARAQKLDPSPVHMLISWLLIAGATVMVSCQVQQPTTRVSTVSSPTSSPAPSATKETVSYGVTRKAYDMMKDGMTKDRCDEIVGFSGGIYKRYQYPAGSGLGSGGYFVSWRNGEAEIAAQFEDGSLIMKFPQGLR